MSPAISTAKRWWLPTLPRRDDTQEASGGFDGGDQHQNCRKAIDRVVPAFMPVFGRHWAITFSLASESAGISRRRRSPSAQSPIGSIHNEGFNSQCVSSS